VVATGSVFAPVMRAMKPESGRYRSRFCICRPTGGPAYRFRLWKGHRAV